MNNVSLNGLRIVVEDLGNEFLVTGVRPYCTYVNNAPTDNVEGYKYMTVLPGKRFARLNVKVPGSQRLDIPHGAYVAVRFDGLEAKLYYDKDNRVQLSVKAMDVHKLGEDKPTGKP